MGDFRPRIKGNLKDAYKSLTKKETRVLVIGDLHEPFCLDGYLEFCLETYRKYNCNKVVFIGDIIDNHYSSYHEQDPDGYGAGKELDLAIKKVKKWSKAFPNAIVTIGNHDRIINRKAYSNGVPKKWVRSYNEVLGVKWEFVESIEIDNVLYIHGEGGEARTKALKNMQSTVQGHLHTKCYTSWHVGNNSRIFGTQVGCGIDHASYAMAYGKHYGKPAIGCAVVVNGKTCINELMDL